MRCLQEHFQKPEFKTKYGQCYDKLAEFTAMEAKDTALNHALTKECKPVISKYCQVRNVYEQNFVYFRFILSYIFRNLQMKLLTMAM